MAWTWLSHGLWSGVSFLRSFQRRLDEGRSAADDATGNQGAGGNPGLLASDTTTDCHRESEIKRKE